ncbi:hypothetical protein BDR07DRAFT_1453645 [Suillus spraguei]|nr:hypothetical protein BDR07DRAFT_1453645 [Suillus spraguei]
MSESTSVAQPKELKHVGIVGAGMAGLYAAYRLQLSNDPCIAVSLHPSCRPQTYTYHLTTPGNRIFINGILKNGGDDSTAKALGFDFSTPYDAKTADALPLSAIQEDFDHGWKILMRLDKVPLRSYLEILGWPPSVIDFTETVCSQTNQLPQVLVEVVGMDNITFGARVQKIKQTSDEQTFDKVILAIPPSALRMIPERPRWDYRKEQAIRAMFYEALGQSTTDLPIRWIVYPSNGIGSEGPGVLLLYSWNTDASVWSSIPFSERLKSSLCHLSKVFPSVDEGNIHFAGEHLSRHHTWITGGVIDSARSTTEEVISDSAFKRTPTGWIPPSGTEPSDHYDPEAHRMKKFEKSVLLNAVKHKY